jgi:ankyrin repeat protein
METGNVNSNQPTGQIPVTSSTTTAPAASGSGEVTATITQVTQSALYDTTPTLQLSNEAQPVELMNEEELPPLVDEYEEELSPSVDEYEAPSPANSPIAIPYKALPSVNLLLELPDELLINIVHRLDDSNDIQNFTQTCSQSRALYKTYIFPQACLKLINKHELDKTEQHKLQQYYKMVLSWIFDPQTETAEIKRLTHLAEKFLKHLSISKIGKILLKILPQYEDEVARILERLADINLPFTASLMAALRKEVFDVHCDILSTKLQYIQKEIKALLIDMHKKMQSANFNSALHYFLQKNHFKIVLALLRASPESVNTCNQEGTSLLMAACSSLPNNDQILPAENLKIARLESLAHLLEEIEEVNTLEELIDLLIKSDEVNINLSDKTGWTILIQAIFDKRLNIVNKLFQRPDLDVNFQDPTGYNALMYASNQLQLGIVNTLLSRNADITAKNDNHHTVLIESILAEGNPELATLIIEALLAKGADLHSQDEHGKTALTYAVLHGRFLAAELLINRGANVNHQDAEGKTLLMHLTANPQHFRVATLLLRKGAMITLQDNNGKSTADYLKTHYSLVGWILNQRESLNLKAEEVAKLGAASFIRSYFSRKYRNSRISAQARGRCECTG